MVEFITFTPNNADKYQYFVDVSFFYAGKIQSARDYDPWKTLLLKKLTVGVFVNYCYKYRGGRVYNKVMKCIKLAKLSVIPLE